MNDTCTAHRSRVPRRSFGRVKWGMTTVEDERGPGLDFSLCFVCGSRPWGAAAFHLCLFILLLKLLHVRRFPPPPSRTYELRYITNYSTGLAPFPRLSAPPHSSHIHIVEVIHLHTTCRICKILIIWPSKRDHTKCILLFFSTGLNKIFHIKYVYI